MINNTEELQAHYDQMYQRGVKRIASGAEEHDSQLLDMDGDQRYGLTLIIKPSSCLLASFQQLLSALHAVEPEQYYYPSSDIHITALSIVSCCAGFSLDQVHIPDYIDIIRACLADLPPMRIRFQGVTCSPSCVMVQGFVDDSSLATLRDRLRDSFRSHPLLQQSLDQRYTLQTAHCTVARLRRPLTDRESYLSVLERFRHFPFGSFEVDALELVGNDWYMCKQKVVLLSRFNAHGGSDVR